MRFADARGAFLAKADLREANLAGANLQGANFHRADLRRADLTEACFHGANLRNRNFEGANVEGTDFTAADLRGSLLTSRNRKYDARQTSKEPIFAAPSALTRCCFVGGQHSTRGPRRGVDREAAAT